MHNFFFTRNLLLGIGENDDLELAFSRLKNLYLFLLYILNCNWVWTFFYCMTEHITVCGILVWNLKPKRAPQLLELTNLLWLIEISLHEHEMTTVCRVSALTHRVCGCRQYFKKLPCMSVGVKNVSKKSPTAINKSKPCNQHMYQLVKFHLFTCNHSRNWLRPIFKHGNDLLSANSVCGACGIQMLFI